MKKKSKLPGKNTSRVEVSGITTHGVWLMVDRTEYFAPFSLFPWFQSAKVSDVCEVIQPHAGHLYWPQLDIDLHLKSLESPEAYPLVAKTPGNRSRKKKTA